MYIVYNVLSDARRCGFGSRAPDSLAGLYYTYTPSSYPQVWIVHTFGSIVTFLVLTNLQSNVDTISRQPVDEVLKVGNLYLALDK